MDWNGLMHVNVSHTDWKDIPEWTILTSNSHSSTMYRENIGWEKLFWSSKWGNIFSLLFVTHFSKNKTRTEKNHKWIFHCLSRRNCPLFITVYKKVIYIMLVSFLYYSDTGLHDRSLLLLFFKLHWFTVYTVSCSHIFFKAENYGGKKSCPNFFN